MTGTFLTSVRYMYTHSTDSLPFDFQAYTGLINSDRLGLLAEGGLPGVSSGTALASNEVTPARFTSSPV
jgi:hypothetical protein